MASHTDIVLAVYVTVELHACSMLPITLACAEARFGMLYGPKRIRTLQCADVQQLKRME